MQGQVVDALTLAGSASPIDFSLWGLFIRADVIVKVVVVMLFVASIWCWAIIIEKFLRIRRLGGLADEFEDSFWSGGSLEDLYDRLGERPAHPMETLFGAAMREWRRSTARGLSHDNTLRAGIRERIAQVMQVSLNREMERLERYLGFLATVGATAPFLGLFGTVWGIMNSFQAIAISKDTNLAVVAPGIAEALIATAAGLFAAIPAVYFYNSCTQTVKLQAAELDDFAMEFLNIAERNFT